MKALSGQTDLAQARKALAGARAQDVAFIILGVLPVGMALASRSATAFLAVAALVSLGGRIAAGEGQEVFARLASLLRMPLARICIAFVVLAAASLAWGNHPRVSGFVLGEFAAAAGAALVLHVSLPRRVPARLVLVAAIAFVLACGVILVDLMLELPLRHALGVRAVTYIYNRPAITLLLVFWPLAALLWSAGRRSLAVVLSAFLLGTVIYCDSGAAVLGLGAGGLAFALPALFRKAAAALVGLGMLGALTVAPVLGDIADRIVPPTVVEELQNAHARDRIEIWQSFGAVVRERALLGTGFGTSAALAQDPVVQDVPEQFRVLLGVWHAHNGYLQIWTELGLAGALIAGVAFVLLLIGVARLPRERLAPALAVVGCAAAIMLVGHSAWQGWWIATLGAAALWSARRLPDVAERSRFESGSTG